MVILAIYRWYRFLSPTIRLTVDSAVFDPARNLIYADIRQRFAIWFIPFYAANVRLVTVLTLVPCHVGPNDLISRPEDQLGPSYQDESSAPRYHQPAARAGGIGAPQVDHDIHVRYRIAQQEDLYQVNEWLRFVLPGLGPAVWTLWQLFSAVLCFAGALVTFPLVWYSFAKASAPSRHARSHPAQDNSDAGTPKVVIHGVESPNRTAKRAQAREPTVDK
ncbi:hypothetical protein VTK73DRAFT_10418 [Phialemonium thermophilum]|uniref:SigF-like NTF2-like domain-containing protein n=1 Tax=Phialemonium thermophilum TaxID=223376 RepID=A0ABR3VWQ2_9PEZI